jgi:hypothetical protein
MMRKMPMPKKRILIGMINIQNQEYKVYCSARVLGTGKARFYIKVNNEIFMLDEEQKCQIKFR